MAEIRKDDPNYRRDDYRRYRRGGFAAFRRISWGAVFAGLVVALVVQFILSLLGVGIGFGAMDPLQEQNPFSGLGTGALIWWVVSILISLFTGGYVAGRLAGMPRTPDSILHGLLTFSMFTIISTYIITTSVGAVLGGVGGLVGQTLSMAGEGVASAAGSAAGGVESSDLQNIQSEAMSILRDAGVSEQELGRVQNQIEQDTREAGQRILTNPQRTGEEIENLIERMAGRADRLMKQVDREDLVNVIQERTGKSREEANRMIDNWESSFENLKQESKQTVRKAEQKAREVSDSVASAISKASIFMFIGLVLGAGAAAVGGKVGEPHDVVTSSETEKEVH